MAKFPALPLWTDAYLADCGHLTDAEHGRYLMLLMMLWRAPRQRIPNDDEWLARHFRRDIDAVKREIRPLVDEFCECDGNWITQARLSREFEYVDSQRKKQSERAKARYKKENTVSRGTATPRSAPTPTPYKKETQDTESETKGESDLFSANGAEPENPSSFDQWWAIYPRHDSKKPAAEKFKAALKKVRFEDLMKATRNYAAAMKAEERQQKYIAMPTTWLNQERWQDWINPQQAGQDTPKGFTLIAGTLVRDVGPH